MAFFKFLQYIFLKYNKPTKIVFNKFNNNILVNFSLIIWIMEYIGQFHYNIHTIYKVITIVTYKTMFYCHDIFLYQATEN